jgi:hypothetical protein
MLWSERFAEMGLMVVMAALVRACYELSRERGSRAEITSDQRSNPLAATTLTDQQRVWAERAVQKYAEAQDKKWQRWNEAMFERV